MQKVPEKRVILPEKILGIVPEKPNLAREKNKKKGEKSKSGREKLQNCGKKWARKLLFARAKSEKLAKFWLLAHFCVSRPKKKH